MSDDALIWELTSDTVVVRRAGDGVAEITINRPERRNALNIEVKSRVADAVEALNADDSIRVMVLTGAGGAFVAGSDVSEMQSLTPIAHTLQATDRMFTTLRASRKPLIAAVEGYALGGGCELALCCDIIVAGETSKFGQPEVLLGVIPGAGGTQRLLRAVGHYQAMRLLLTGMHIPATEAFTIGLVSEVVADGASLERAVALAAKISTLPALAVTAIKDVVRAGADIPLDTALLLERKTFQVLFDSADQKEGMTAFLEKRPPIYTGR